MSSLRNAVKRRTHRERSQPSSRKSLGLLEKHKDYVLRARDHHKKNDHLRLLKQKAALRNPDEFYFAMQKTGTKEGVHQASGGGSGGEASGTLGGDMLKLFKGQDLAYVQHKRVLDDRKAERLQASLHFLGAQTNGEDGGNNNKRKHTIFVDSAADAEGFDAAEHFDTVEELTGRSFNRPRRDMLAESGLLAGTTSRAVRKAAKKRKAAYAELAQRVDRSRKLESVAEHLQCEKNLMGKGKRVKVRDAGADRPAVYKWKKQRKR